MQTGTRSAYQSGFCVVALLVLLTLAAGAQRMAAQSSDGTPSAAIPTGDGSWPEIHLNVVVTDKHGAPQKIDQQTFHLFEDGVERPLHFPEPADSPVSLALLIDSSGSIFKRKAEILSAVTTILHALPADSEVMGVLFTENAYIDLPLTPVSKVDFSFLDRLQANGKTALWDAVVATENHLVAHGKYARKALVLLSDGEDNASVLTGAMTLRSILQPGAPTIYTCRVNDKPNILNSDAEAASIHGRKVLKFLAEEGGGFEFNLEPDPAAVAAQIVAAIRSQYVLQFTAADTTRNGKIHKLVVRLPVKDVRIDAPPAYFAPKK
jgi:Ca-activated chloride channel family protein